MCSTPEATKLSSLPQLISPSFIPSAIPLHEEQKQVQNPVQSQPTLFHVVTVAAPLLAASLEPLTCSLGSLKSKWQQAAKNATIHPQDIHGYLHKMGGSTFTGVKWQKRYFKIDLDPRDNNFYLSYGSTEKHVKTRIYLPGATCNEATVTSVGKSNCFSVRPAIQHSRKEYYMFCESPEDMYRWIAAIRRAAAGGKVETAEDTITPPPGNTSNNETGLHDDRATGSTLLAHEAPGRLYPDLDGLFL